MGKLIKFIKTLFYIVKDYKEFKLEIKKQKDEFDALRALIVERTTYHVDVNYRGDSTIICIGKYNGKDFIQTYSVHNQDFIDIVCLLQKLKNMAD